MNLKEKLSKKLKKTGGFTLIEMLIVVAIIAILVAISVPMVNSSLENARVAADEANLRSAKAVAVICAMNGKLSDGTTAITAGTEYYYNVSDGAIVSTKPTAATDKSSLGQSETNKGDVIQIVFADVTFDPTVSWEA